MAYTVYTVYDIPDDCYVELLLLNGLYSLSIDPYNMQHILSESWILNSKRMELIEIT